jgi:uncharacterized membrane protein YphA (DoxX/SURF4 family)
LIGVVFLAAGFDKALAIADFAVVLDYHLPFLPDHPAWSSAAACVTSLWEVVLGVALISGFRARQFAIIGMLTVLLFSFALLRVLIDPRAPQSCGCGRIASMLAGDSTALHGIIRNIALAALLAIPLVLRRHNIED